MPRKNKDECTAAAVTLAAELGPGWEPVVWENLGWHWKVRNGGVKIHFEDGTYSAFLSDDAGGGGYWVGDGDTAAAAIRDGLRLAAAHISAIEQAKARLDELTHPSRVTLEFGLGKESS